MRKPQRRHILVVAVLVLAGIAAFTHGSDTERQAPAAEAEAPPPPPERGARPESVSLVDLLAHPDDYHGKFVRVTGFLHVQFEGTAIYMTKEHADYLMGKYGLWVSLDLVQYPERQYHGHYVLLEGVFNKHNKGHRGLWSGELRHISRITLLRRFYDGAEQLPGPDQQQRPIAAPPAPEGKAAAADNEHADALTEEERAALIRIALDALEQRRVDVGQRQPSVTVEGNIATVDFPPPPRILAGSFIIRIKRDTREIVDVKLWR